MFNVAVINIKDIVRYLIKALILIAVLAIIASFFKAGNKTGTVESVTRTIENTGNAVINYSFLQCLDICVPGMKQIDFNKAESFTMEKLLAVELPLSNHIIEEETDANGLVENNESSSVSIQNNNNYEISIPENITTEVIKNHVPESYSDVLENVNIKNGTDIELTNEMVSQELTFANSKKILIYHTHTCESYTSSETYPYEMTGNYRTTDLNYSVARVGTELANYLTNNGFSVIHDTTYYDYPAYTGSYDRAYDSVKSELENSPDTEILFDIHRDAIGDSSYAPTVKIGDEYAAQMMFVIGSNGGGLDHPNWLQNLSLAVKIQKRANEKYPGLFKPIILRNSRYNQHLAKGASIIEVGATGNTLEQCITSMKYLADVLKDVL